MTDGTLTDIDLDTLCLFLDFDGTLVDLAPTPDGIAVPAGLPSLLTRLHARLDGRLALISGREVAVLDGFIPGYPGDIHGAHGAEWRMGGTYTAHPMAEGSVVRAAQAQAQAAAGSLPGLTIETKRTGVVIHYRAVPAAEPHARAIAQMIVADAPGMELHPSKLAYEIRPDDVGKADAVARAMAGQSPGLVPLMIGDDLTDEAAMVRAMALGGAGVRVGPGESVARWRLDDPGAVLDLLTLWADRT
ncbi:trehalose 6-phosphatase [Loktanella fryxellensis]|uniref:Trehalose 6-phosphate phosphatase n=1 Tax=Loktanella fryxellensis TaxID=245187 RepID=A0A1H8EN32_9RHOB|nr:trehalose-phosphatase [Loktanella fryxellensis]SEN20929.1 trehalose 6-phosphatase [Loktanella fryxellensis]